MMLEKNLKLKKGFIKKGYLTNREDLIIKTKRHELIEFKNNSRIRDKDFTT